MDIDENGAEFEFSNAATRINSLTENEEIMLHNACHLSFRSHISSKELKYKTHDVPGESQPTENDEEQELPDIDAAKVHRSKRKSGGEVNRICFVCNEMKDLSMDNDEDDTDDSDWKQDVIMTVMLKFFSRKAYLHF